MVNCEKLILRRKSRDFEHYLAKSVTTRSLRELCKKHGLSYHGNKMQLISTVRSTLTPKIILEELQPEKSLSPYAKLFVRALLDGANTRHGILGHSVVSVLLNKINNDSNIRYGKENFVDSFMRRTKTALVNKGMVRLIRTGRDWTYSLLPEFSDYFQPFLTEVTPEWAIESFVKSQDYKLMAGFPLGATANFPKETETVTLDRSLTFPLTFFLFSDYRRQKFSPLIEHLEESSLRPDLILYGGDDIERFNLAPLEQLEFSEDNGEFSEELRPVTLSTKGTEFSWVSSSQWGYVLKLPSDYPQSLIKERLVSVAKLVAEVQRKEQELKNHELLTIRELFQDLSDSLDVREAQQSFSPGTDVIVSDAKMKSTILRMTSELDPIHPTSRQIWSQSAYWQLGLRIDSLAISAAKIRFIKSVRGFSYYHVCFGHDSEDNIFERLSSHSKYGIGAVIGNDDWRAIRSWIRGQDTYDLQLRRLRIGNLLIAGLEGGVVGEESLFLGPTLYSEENVRSYLAELRKELKPNDRLIIVSHTPPKGVLDRAIRFTDGPIGSQALRDFVESEDRVLFVICGHVHRCGGQSERLGNAEVINVSSHDDVFSRANVGWLTITEDLSAKIKFVKLPSFVESILTENTNEKESLLAVEAHLSKNESKAFLSVYSKHGHSLFANLEGLAHIKFELGLPWTLVMMIYDLGVTKLEELSERHFEKIKPLAGIQISHLQKSLVKFKRLTLENRQPFLISELRLPSMSKVICFDTEYDDEGQVVLFGFLEMGSSQFEQFWFERIEDVKRFLLKRRESVFVHWGGSDRMLLNKTLDFETDTFNLLYKVQTTLVAQIESARLKDVYDGLCGHNEQELWKTCFYEIDGIEKLSLCKRVLAGVASSKDRERLEAANKIDTLALSRIVERLRKMPCQVHN